MPEKLKRKRHHKGPRRQRGRAVTQGLPIKRPLPIGPGASRRFLIGGHAITAHSLRPLPLCTSARAPAIPRRMRRRIPGSQPLRYCAVSSEGKDRPWKHRWAGAATPTQRNTTRPQEPPRRASDVVYGSNLYAKDNPRWVISNATETPKVPESAFWLLSPVSGPW